MDFAAHLGCPLPAMQVPRCQSQMTIVNQFFCSPRRKWFSDVPAELRGGDISVDRSRSELISRIPKSKKRYPRRQCPRAMHARHDARLANGMRPIRRPSVTIDHIVNRRSRRGSDSSYLQKKPRDLICSLHPHGFLVLCVMVVSLLPVAVGGQSNGSAYTCVSRPPSGASASRTISNYAPSLQCS